MMDRREAIVASALLASQLARATDPHAQAGTSTTQQAGLLFRQDLPDLALEGWEVTARYVDMAPGRIGAAHQHPGFVLVYVVSGAVISKVSGQGPEREYKAGEMFYEQPGATHEVSRNASRTEPARILAMIFAKKGAAAD